MTPHGFEAATTLVELGDGRYGATVHDSWYQGPGAYGGLTAALLLKAIRAADGDRSGRSPRSLDVHLCAPVVDDETEIEVRLERAGAKVAFYSARLFQAGAVAAFAGASLALPRDVDLDFDDARRATPGPRDEGLNFGGVPQAPAYTQHFDLRMAHGPFPFSGADEAKAGGWIALREAPDAVLDETLATALLDAWYPALFARLDRMRPAASVDFRVQFHAPLAQAARGPWWLECESLQGRDGYCDETDELFDADGRRLASCHQLYALLK